MNQYKKIKKLQNNISFNTENQQNEIMQNIKCDLIINRDMSLNNNIKLEEFKISLISNFYFSVILGKIKDTDENLKLILNIKDELDDINVKKEYELNQIDFICEAEILKINYKEYQESMKVMQMIENNDKQDENKIYDNINKFQNEKIDMIEYNQITDIVKNFDFLKNIAKENIKLKVIDVDGINKNIDLI